MEASEGVRRRCRVGAEPHPERGVTLYGADGRTYQVIDAVDAARDRLATLTAGDAVTVVLEPVRCRGDGWRVTAVAAASTDDRVARPSRGDAGERPAARPASR